MSDTKSNIITKPLTSEEKKDMELVKKIKPKLRKFVIEGQRKNAEQVAKEQKKEQDFLLGNEEVIRRASQLACLAMLDKKIWQKIPPYLEMKWTKLGANTPALAQEMHSDISGFTTYLVREYNNYLKLHVTGNGYPNPMQDQNIEFFWSKFNADLKLLIEAEMRRVSKGNKSLILGHKTADGEIESFKDKIIN